MDGGCVSLVFRGEFWAGQHSKLQLDELSKWCQVQEGSELSGVLSSGVRKKKRKQSEADEKEWHHQTSKKPSTPGLLSLFPATLR